MFKDILAFIGGASLIGMAIIVLTVLWDICREWVRKIKYNYRVKHRFDKPPIAKCYCVDCKQHDNETGRCWRFGATTKEYICTADNWFCWEAEPRGKD